MAFSTFFRFLKNLPGYSSSPIAWPRSVKQVVLILVDCACLFFAVWGAYSLRIGQFIEPTFWQWVLFAAAPLVAIPVFAVNGLYRSVIRYVGEKALWQIIKSMFLAVLLWSALVFFLDVQRFEAAPRSVPPLYLLLGTCLVAASRFGARWLIWLPVRRRISDRQVLIFGANPAGIQLAESLMAGQDLFPAGFVDDTPSLIHKDVSGIRVYPPNRLAYLIDHYEIREAIVCLPQASSARRREVVELLEKHRLRVKILPALSELATGKNLVNLIRDVDVGDLLGRDAVTADQSILSKCIRGKVVLVTGAGGSIGSELCSQIASLGPAKLILFDQSEPALYQVHRKIESTDLCPVVPCLGSVSDKSRVTQLFEEHGIQTVYHAAAHKHVPLVEGNVAEGVKNNIFGTQTVARAAMEQGAETFVLISTDKAVRPTNVMGATKRWAEIAIQNLSASNSGTVFCAVRFGNVLGSSGSVIPLFKEQIAKGGPVTVTHPEINRFFMSIHEAVELVIQASSMAKGGEIFLLDMGESVKILDLAHNMIRLAGFRPLDPATGEGDIAIEFSGLRPGEKLYEELLIDNNNAVGTLHPKILAAHEPNASKAEFTRLMAELTQFLEQRDESSARELLLKVANP
ncbi:FlaA1/EpsC-like NDP-sugar epimerase [Limnobacter thiooxidans]|uniref:Nucleoside-diphosphate sugar epimerase/dehydratase n=1 Tax=Limnobacter thiooxidans TaxID=131080 RepID=A0AA86IYV4_9BURK|nr:FlaA1/EpsC-like NDP-sugar epimerase [Limnobacter thiooxidans]BET24736.1 nucleoside-diphosphate sugar epimerase/dehydratase [Limnobacter thiooxidans]